MNLFLEANKRRNEAQRLRGSIEREYDLSDTYLGLDSLLKGAWGSKNVNALGGGKTQIEKAHRLLGKLIEEEDNG